MSGIELIFPHHENTIAISQAVTNSPLANYWVHNELVMKNDKGVSKGSADNLALKDLLDEEFTGREVRYWLLSRHYRKPIFFSRSKLRSARNTIAHMDKFVQKIHFSKPAQSDPEIDQAVFDLRQRFAASMDDDINIAAALAALFRFTRHINKIMDQKGLSSPDRDKILKAMEKVNLVLGVMDLEPPEMDRDMEILVAKREDARRNKDWQTADRLRGELREMGIEVIDTEEGPVWSKLKP